MSARQANAALAIAPIEDADVADVVSLWERCGPE
jgi:hypothetical protein